MNRAEEIISEKSFGKLAGLFFMAGIEIISAEIDLRIELVFNDEFGSLKKHGVRDIDMDGYHFCSPIFGFNL